MGEILIQINAMFALAATLVVTLCILAAVIVGGLSYHDGATPASAILTAGKAFIAMCGLLLIFNVPGRVDPVVIAGVIVGGWVVRWYEVC
ncbi:hypothetical protein, partial [Frankia sp. ACN1ag]|uniref:hypothetical protein n=1 Tax=Frankia sp. ACN1ag TaxID=102891 RepID=UPI001F178D25